MLKEFRLKRRLKKNDIELLNISEGTLRIYRTQVNGNRYKTDTELSLKLNRNWLLGVTIKNTDRVETRCYGNLRITYSKIKNQIVYIWNYRGAKEVYDINMEERAKLNKILGIKEKKVA